MSDETKVSLKHRIEVALTRVLLGLFARMPADKAADLCAALTTPLAWLPHNRSAEENLRRALPELDRAGRRSLIRAMWRGMGRTVGELPHIKTFEIDGSGPVRIEVEGAGGLKREIDAGRPVMFAAAHQANWELLPLVARQLGCPIHVVFRAANNPLFDQVITDMRGDIALGTIAKGAAGGRQLLAALRKGESVGMLIDQKMNEGLPVPFFGRPAMTAPAIAQLARRLDVAIVPAQCRRLPDNSYQVTLHEPLDAKRSEDRDADVLEVMTELNAMIEDWVRLAPEQWLWLHKRWPRDDGATRQKRNASRPQ